MRAWLEGIVLEINEMATHEDYGAAFNEVKDTMSGRHDMMMAIMKAVQDGMQEAD
jgi:hypothetical protein